MPNAGQPYQAGGIVLTPGDYEVNLSASGYESTQKTITHGEHPTRHHVVLTPAGAALTIVTFPEEAQIRIVEGPPYTSGMTLPPGRYDLEVTAPAYEPERLSILHGTEPARHHVALRPRDDSL